jgi:TP901 family phage tail tape measure protein
LDAEQSIVALPRVAAFAQAGMFDMSRATDLLTDAQSALGLSSDDAAENLENMTRVSDVLVKIATVANTSVEQLGEALTEKVAAASASAGLELESVAGALAVFADSGVKGSAAGTKLTAVIASLQKGTRDNTQAFEKFGLEIYNAEGAMRPLEDIVSDMEGAFGDMTIEQRNSALAQLGLNRQALDGINLLMGNADAMSDYADAAADAGGITEEVAEKQLQTLSAQFEILQSKINDVGIEIGKKLGPTMEALVDALGPVIEQVGDVLVEAFDLLAPVIADAAKELPGLLSALIPVLPLMVDIARTVLELAIQLLPIFLGVIQELLPLVQRFAGFIADNADKVGIFVIALGGLILAIKAFNIILGISKLIQVTWAAATGVATVAQKGLNLAMKANPIGIIITLVVALVGALIWFFTQTETGKKIWAGFVGFLTTTMQAIGDFFKFLFTEFFPGLWQGMIDFFTGGWDKFKDFFFTALGAIGDFFKGVINGWISLFEGFVNGIIAGLNWIIRQANKFSIDVPATPFGPAFKIGFNLKELSNIQLPRLAEGGIVNRETLAIIGEAGPEAVIPLDRLGSMGATYNITVNAGVGTNGPEVGRAIVAEIKKYERSSGRVFASA